MQRTRQTFSASSIPNIILMFAHEYVTIAWPWPDGTKHEEQSYTNCNMSNFDVWHPVLPFAMIIVTVFDK